MMPMASGEGGPMPMMPMPGSDGGQMPMMPMPGEARWTNANDANAW